MIDNLEDLESIVYLDNNLDVEKILITFGCSWTYGVGLSYAPGMTFEDYQQGPAWDADICDAFSWRGLLSKQHGLTNINFAQGGSSNQKQFRLAKEFFLGRRFRELHRTASILVLWGITSTARNEMFNSQTGKLENFFYSEEIGLAKMMTMFSYDHCHEVQTLDLEIRHWSDYFARLDIPCYWFDTFNHHDYPSSLPGMIEHKPHRDQMSYLVKTNSGDVADDRYHTSDWKSDNLKVDFLVQKGILNPYSYHPTRLGHQQLCDFFGKKIIDSF